MSKIFLRVGVLALFSLSLVACTSGPGDFFNKKSAYDKSLQYIVRKGDSLYTIAWRTGHDYKKLAQLNNITYPYKIYPGQKIIFSNELKVDNTANLNTKKGNSLGPVIAALPPKTSIKMAPLMAKKSIQFSWPVKGNVMREFSETHLSKGIDIGGKLGTAIKAAAKGSVVYSGSALKNYGNLVIIKHDDNFLSAYAHNQTTKVKEGQMVVAGQEIARLGQSGTTEPKLHFEIRFQGKPVDPIKYLPEQN